MKSTIDQLSVKEKEALAEFYNTEAYKALEKFCKLDIAGLGRDALQSPSQEQTKYLQGKAHYAEYLPKLVHELYKQVNKES